MMARDNSSQMKVSDNFCPRYPIAGQRHLDEIQFKSRAYVNHWFTVFQMIVTLTERRCHSDFNKNNVFKLTKENLPLSTLTPVSFKNLFSKKP